MGGVSLVLWAGEGKARSAHLLTWTHVSVRASLQALLITYFCHVHVEVVYGDRHGHREQGKFISIVAPMALVLICEIMSIGKVYENYPGQQASRIFVACAGFLSYPSDEHCFARDAGGATVSTSTCVVLA